MAPHRTVDITTEYAEAVRALLPDVPQWKIEKLVSLAKAYAKAMAVAVGHEPCS